MRYTNFFIYLCIYLAELTFDEEIFLCGFRAGLSPVCTGLVGHAGVVFHYCDVSSPVRNQNICGFNYPQTYLLTWTGAHS